MSIQDDSFGGDEADGKDEAIVLESGYLLVDEDLKQFVSKLPKGANFTAIMDCCHSGGLLDGKSVIISGNKKHDKKEHSREIEVSEERGAHAKAREMPVKMLASILSNKLGKSVSPTRHGIAGAEASLFGGDSSALAMQFAASIFNGGKKAGGNPVEALLRAASSGGGGAAAGMNAKQMAAFAGLAGSLLGKQPAGGGSAPRGSDRGMASMLSMLGLGGEESVTSQGAPPYRPTSGKLDEDKGILITGCGPTETSADVRPRNGKAHGALTNALYQYWEKNQDASNRELVLGVRKYLLGKGTKQNPQLECAPGLADREFICKDSPKTKKKTAKTEKKAQGRKRKETK